MDAIEAVVALRLQPAGNRNGCLLQQRAMPHLRFVRVRSRRTVPRYRIQLERRPYLDPGAGYLTRAPLLGLSGRCTLPINLFVHLRG